MPGYITNAEMRTFYDVRRLKDLLSDEGTGDAMTTGEVDGSALLTAAVLWASSEIDSKCQNGKRYSRTDLEAMATAGAAGSDTEKKRAAVLKKLTADLAFGFLASRRGQSADQLRELAPGYDDALMRLESLYKGERVFDLDSTLNATVPTSRRVGKLAFLQSRHNEMFGVFDDHNGMFN